MAVAHATTTGPILLHVSFSGLHKLPPVELLKAGVPPMPFRGRVRLHHQPSGRLVAEAWTDAADSEQELFIRIAPGTYYIVAFDHTGEYGGVIETDIASTPMGA